MKKILKIKGIRYEVINRKHDFKDGDLILWNGSFYNNKNPSLRGVYNINKYNEIHVKIRDENWCYKIGYDILKKDCIKVRIYNKQIINDKKSLDL
jgi:hypothetical protein